MEKKTRFEILCKDGVWRFVFCRSGNSTDRKTGCAVICTEAKERAYVSFSPEKDLAYFTEYANGAKLRVSLSFRSDTKNSTNQKKWTPATTLKSATK